MTESNLKSKLNQMTSKSKSKNLKYMFLVLLVLTISLLIVLFPDRLKLDDKNSIQLASIKSQLKKHFSVIKNSLTENVLDGDFQNDSMETRSDFKKNVKQKDGTQFKKNFSSIVQSVQNEISVQRTKYLLYYCGDKHICYGWADRQRGIHIGIGLSECLFMCVCDGVYVCVCVCVCV